MKNCYQIESDVFNIAKRLKLINAKYLLFFNKKLQQFEVFLQNGYEKEFCFSFKSQYLDCSLLEKVRANVYKDNDQLIKEIEEHNQKLEQADEQKVNDISSYKLHQIYKYAQGGSKEFEMGFEDNWI